MHGPHTPVSPRSTTFTSRDLESRALLRAIVKTKYCLTPGATESLVFSDRVTSSYSTSNQQQIKWRRKYLSLVVGTTQ